MLNTQAKKSQTPPDVYFFASENYFPTREKLLKISEELADLLKIDTINCRFRLLTNSDEVDAVINSTLSAPELGVFVPFSGQVQRGMLELATRYKNVAIVNAYLPGFGLSDSSSSELLCANAHPAAVDVFARLKQMNINAFWISTLDDFQRLMVASAAIASMRHSRLLSIGGTEAWVINSCVDPRLIRARFGVEILHVGQDILAERFKQVQDGDVSDWVDGYLSSATDHSSINKLELTKASRLAMAVKLLLEENDADGCALACFALIKTLDTTGCLALSQLNDSEKFIGACEGDLDAALTMLLMKNLGAENFWMGNPIIFPENEIQLVHCTSARKQGDVVFDYRLMPHHESGKGVSLDVQLPVGQEVTLARIGNDLSNILVCRGKTKPVAKLKTCRTQSRIVIPSSEKFVSAMTGTHVISSLGDFSGELEYFGRLKGLQVDVC